MLMAFGRPTTGIAENVPSSLANSKVIDDILRALIDETRKTLSKSSTKKKGMIQVTDYELKLGGRNIRVTEEMKHEYVGLVADHILTNAIRPQINSFLEGFNELVPRELISISMTWSLSFL